MRVCKKEKTTYASSIGSASLRKISTLVTVLPDDTIAPLNKRTHNVRRRSHTHTNEGNQLTIS